eukprot:886129-Prymnesium_polylepis.2
MYTTRDAPPVCPLLSHSHSPRKHLAVRRASLATMLGTVAQSKPHPVTLSRAAHASVAATAARQG